MKRSVRNGIAIAGMVGGFWLLGQAVASADEQVADAGAATSSSQSSDSSGGDATNVNGSDNSASAENVAVTRVETDVDGGDGGTNIAAVNTGVISSSPQYVPIGTASYEEPNGEGQHPDVVKVDTGDVEVNQEANGGDVSGSGNAKVEDSGGNQTATATATTDVEQHATSEDEHGHGDWWKPRETQTASLLGSGGPGGGHDADASNVNWSDNHADASNKDITSVETDVDGGDGGLNVAIINTGIIGDLYCHEGGCIYYIRTGDVTVNQSANGGDVSDSGNVKITDGDKDGDRPGKDDERPGKDEDCPKTVLPPAQEHVTPVKVVTVLPTAQPSGQLAFTGADVSEPLALGLLALGAGIGLTVLGRRRMAPTA